MRFHMIYSNQFAIGNKPIGIASLAAMAKKAGHKFKLFDCTQYKVISEHKGDDDIDWNLAGAKTVAFKHPANPERLPYRKAVTYRELIEKLIQEIDAFKPDIIGLSALTDDYPLGLGLMRKVRKTFSQIPTIAGGIHATVDPTGVIGESCFDMVCIGEGEHVILDLANRIDSGGNFEGIPNLWIKKPDGSIVRNTVRPYEQDLDSFPYPDWTIYPEIAFYKPFLGYVHKYGDFEMSRGCPYKCSYCINVQLQEIYKQAGPQNYHREKSITRVINEINWAVENYQIEFLKFWDETFLLMSKERMEEFRDLYSGLRIPYVIETTGQSITPFSAKILHDTNCKSVSIGMETGNPDIRKGMLSKPVNNDIYVVAYDLLKEHGINKVSFNMIGLPNESQEDVFRTIGLNRLVGTETQAVGIFYPYKGTPIRDMMITKNLLDNDFDLKDLKDYDFNTFTAGNRSVVKFKDMDSKLLNRIWMLFSSYCFWPVKYFPLIDYVKDNNNSFALTLLFNIQRMTYFKKFGEWPPDDEENMEATPASHAGELMPKASIFPIEESAEFAQLLMQYWRGEDHEKLVGLLEDIARGELKPQFPLPTNDEELAVWLDIDLDGKDSLRQIRADYRHIAQSKGKAYLN